MIVRVAAVSAGRRRGNRLSGTSLAPPSATAESGPHAVGRTAGHATGNGSPGCCQGSAGLRRLSRDKAPLGLGAGIAASGGWRAPDLVVASIEARSVIGVATAAPVEVVQFAQVGGGRAPLAGRVFAALNGHWRCSDAGGRVMPPL